MTFDLRILLAFCLCSFATSAFAADPKPTFANEGVAFLKAHCLACHGATKPKADLSLHGFMDDASVLKDRKTWQRVVEAVKEGEMPPPNKPRPTVAEVDRFLKIVGDAFETADKTAKLDPGRVTMRRLNKVEYNNTVRDLMGIDFTPADDFPSDDVGHGFDNIGDVLTLSPVLFERYLAAAETIVDKAITPVPPKPPTRGVGIQFTEPAGPKIPLKNGWREVTAKPTGSPQETGPINTPYKVPSDGDYIFQTKAYIETASKEPVQIAIIACCEKNAPGMATESEMEKIGGAAAKNVWPCVIVKIVEIKARTEKDAETITVKIPPNIGLHRMAVALVKTKPGEPLPTMYLRSMSLEGPFDTRPASHRKLLAREAGKPQAEQTKEVLTRFVNKAYRRPATAEEIARLTKFVDAAVARGELWEAGIQLAMQAVLVSPKFLFRVELDDRPGSADAHAIDEYHLASRLSYFLWATMPDDELFALAAKKELAKNLPAQVERMLKDPRSKSLVDQFAMQWLQLQNLRNFQPDSKQFPSFRDSLRSAMFEETRLFFLEIVRENRSILDILDADYTYVNQTLAKHYGIADTAGNLVGQKATKPGGKPFTEKDFVRVNVAGTPRGGVLTQASVLAVTSNPTRTSPVKRGRWVLEQLLGAPPPPPPPDVPELKNDDKAISGGSLRQRMEDHRKNPACANCHAKMDPLGFGLENFNAIGAFRAKDGEFPVDASGVLPDGKTFAGPTELKGILKAKKDQFARCLAEKLMTYALGRGLEYYDKKAIDKIVAQLAKHDYKFATLVTEIVSSDPFKLRRGKDQK